MHNPPPDTGPFVDRCDREHGLWLAMRSAYNDYRDASEALDAVASRGPIAISAQDRILGIGSLAAKERVEFERYIEKRLQYSECVRDRGNFAATHFGFQETADDSTAPKHHQGGHVLWLGIVTSGIAVGAALVCITFFILREQRRTHDLDISWNETSATLNHTRDELHSLSRQLSAFEHAQSLASQKVVGASAASRRPDPISVGWSAAGSRPVVPSQNRTTTKTSGSMPTEVATAVARKYEEPSRSPKSGGRRYSWFTLTPSTQFKQVGTIGLSLRKNPKQKYFSLRLIVENSKVEKKHVKLDEPVWIVRNHLQSVGVVVTRIEKNYVQGYVSEPNHRIPHMTATDQARQSARRRS